MELSWLQSLILGLISGITEILPVSAQAHRLLLLKLFGINAEHPVFRLTIHICTALALYFCCRVHIIRMLRAVRLSKVPKKRRKRPLDMEGLSDFNLLRTTLIPVILGLALYTKTAPLADSAIAVSVLLLVNGIVLYIPQYLPGSNKESSAMTRIDGLIMGLGGAAATLPGISCLGTSVSIASVRGMDLKKALNLALLMCVPVNLGLAAFDLVALLGGGAGSLSLVALVGAVLAGITAFLGVILGIRLLNKIVEAVGYSVFGFYCWGAAMLTFILFLAAV